VTLLVMAPDEGDANGPDAADSKTRRPPRPEERLAKARKLLDKALEKDNEEGKAKGKLPVVGQVVDKYFGTKLPPVCARLGCYVTDDGKRFYCVNPSCQKHKKRETKHTRRGRPTKGHFVYFKCPRCASRSVDMSILSNKYSCRSCRYVWER
jgi:ribosomal protein S27E